MFVKSELKCWFSLFKKINIGSSFKNKRDMISIVIAFGIFILAVAAGFIAEARTHKVR